MVDRDDQVDPDLAALYAAERAAPLPDGASARVLAGALAAVTATTAAAGSATAAVASGGKAVASTATGWTTAKVVAIAVASAIAGGTLGVVGYTQLTSQPPVQTPAPPPQIVPTPVLEPDAVISIDAGVPPDAAGPDPRARVHTASESTEAAPAEDVREPLLIDRARAALRRGMIDEALTTLMAHERIHPHGALAEERDVLVIEAYVAKGEGSVARRRIERYRQDHPDGFLRSRVDRAEAQIRP